MTPSHHIEPVSSFPPDQILGIGRTGLVVRDGQVAVKLPLRWSTSSDEEVEANIEALQHEQAIYQRLDGCAGAIPCLGCSETATKLRLMEKGDLRAYLSHQNAKPSKTLQLSWFRSMAHALSRIHDRRVIVADIATRNFLLEGPNLHVHICDFTESILLAPDTPMATADWVGYSIHTDIGQLGAVMYEVVAGEKCGFNIFQDCPVERSRGHGHRGRGCPGRRAFGSGRSLNDVGRRVHSPARTTYAKNWIPCWSRTTTQSRSPGGSET